MPNVTSTSCIVRVTATYMYSVTVWTLAARALMVDSSSFVSLALSTWDHQGENIPTPRNLRTGVNAIILLRYLMVRASP